MIEGNYKATGTIAGKPVDGILELHVSGTELNGMMDFMGSKAEIQNGEVDGDSFKFASQVTIPVGNVRIKVNGEVKGDEISFTIKTPIGKFPLTGTRV